MAVQGNRSPSSAPPSRPSYQILATAWLRKVCVGVDNHDEIQTKWQQQADEIWPKDDVCLFLLSPVIPAGRAFDCEAPFCGMSPGVSPLILTNSWEGACQPLDHVERDASSYEVFK